MIRIGTAAELDRSAVLAIAAGERVQLSPELLTSVATRRTAALAALAEGPEVYGVTTGMGALSDTRLSVDEQTDHSRRLMLARAVGGAPWLDRVETRAVIAVRLRTFLEGDAAVSADLCSWLAALLEHDRLPPVPRTGAGSSGEILPLAHAWGHLAGVGTLDPPLPDGLTPPVLGPKEGLALLAGVPTATALAALRGADLVGLGDRALVVAAASIQVAGVSRDPYEAVVARGDAVLAEVLADLRALLVEPIGIQHLQAPVSYRVVGPVQAHLRRETDRLVEVADRALGAVGDSPAFDTVGAEPRFVGTAGFHGLEHAAAFDAARAAVVHLAAVSAARLHRLLDPAVTGLPAQLSADPGPQTGFAPLHKRAVAAVHEVAGWPSSYGSPAETSGGQEDVQTFALTAAERLRAALEAADLVLACELLAVHQAVGLAPERAPAGALGHLLDEVADLLPDGVDDRPRGPDVEQVRGLFRSGWGVSRRTPGPSCP